MLLQHHRASRGHSQVAAGQGERPRDQPAEFSVTDNEHAIIGRNPNLLLNFHRRGQRLDEDCFLRLDRIGNDVQIFDGQGEVLRECTVAILDPENRAFLAVRGTSIAAGLAGVRISGASGSGTSVRRESF